MELIKNNEFTTNHILLSVHPNLVGNIMLKIKIYLFQSDWLIYSIAFQMWFI